MPRRGQAAKVLEVALRLFDTEGYSATTIEDIKLQSEVSVGSIYHHFGNKEGIAGALYLDSLDDFRRSLSPAFARTGAEEGVRAAVANHLRWCEANRARARFLMRRRETEVAAITRTEVDAINGAIFESIDLWYQPHIAAGAIRELPLPLLYAIWFGPAQEYARTLLEHQHSKRLRSLALAEPALADAAWAALRP